MHVTLFALTALFAASVQVVRGGTAPPPIACNLKALTAHQRQELMHRGERVISAITSARELSDGYAFFVDPAEASLLDVAQWLELWRRCCPFYEFRIDFHATDASLWLSVKGRPGVKEFIPLDVPQLNAKLPSPPARNRE